MYLPSYLEISLYCTVQCTYPCTLDLLVCVDHSFYNRFFSCFAGFLKSVFTNVSQYFFCYFYSCCFVNFFLHLLVFFLWLYLSLSLLQYWCGFSLFPIVCWLFILSFFLHKPFRNLNLFLLCLFFYTLSLSRCSCSFSPHLWLSLCLFVPPCRVQGRGPGEWLECAPKWAVTHWVSGQPVALNLIVW